MRVHANTLYVMSQGASIGRERETLRVRIEGKTRLRVPLHHLESVVCFGRIFLTPAVIGLCGERGVGLTYLTPQGRFQARLERPCHGNVLLRREQYRQSDSKESALLLARPMIAAKIQNSRALLLRAARSAQDTEKQSALQHAAKRMAALLVELPSQKSLDAARGIEGAAAAAYFKAFGDAVRDASSPFTFGGRTRRPPKDPINAMLSFAYALLRHDCDAALQAVGLDPAVGFLHADRPGRLSLALDLMEEFRPLLADRIILSLVNRKQVNAKEFTTDPSGSVSMDESARRTLLAAYQARKRLEVAHPLLKETVPFGLLPHIQARLLARTLRSDIDAYPALVLR
ncbi:CRISPR-associated protein Cas4/endonuclease Cas1 fusion [Planctomycetes bacterium Pan216]|uniref:CRISPR-associated endonuclease Cas1 n=1 Tax=Kolteria novifilia TaxID=2527975 RepID=A0A518B612_9BACT|nr:CRISPR-associated protein Cas4/endonuclease Cas1 fusion [Planctomycetes bacterium Pan216]